MRIGSLRGVPTDMRTDLNHLRRLISGSRAARVYGDHPVGRPIADAVRRAELAVFGIAAAAIVMAFLIVVGIPNGILLLREFHIAH